MQSAGCCRQRHVSGTAIVLLGYAILVFSDGLCRASAASASGAPTSSQCSPDSAPLAARRGSVNHLPPGCAFLGSCLRGLSRRTNTLQRTNTLTPPRFWRSAGTVAGGRHGSAGCVAVRYIQRAAGAAAAGGAHGGGAGHVWRAGCAAPPPPAHCATECTRVRLCARAPASMSHRVRACVLRVGACVSALRAWAAVELALLVQGAQ